jgi:hypothetical protein
VAAETHKSIFAFVVGNLLNAMVGIPSGWLVLVIVGLGANANDQIFVGFLLCAGIAASSFVIGWIAAAIAGTENIRHGVWSTLLCVLLINFLALNGGVPIVCWFAFSVISPVFGGLGDRVARWMRRQPAPTKSQM